MFTLNLAPLVADQLDLRAIESIDELDLRAEQEAAPAPPATPMSLSAGRDTVAPGDLVALQLVDDDGRPVAGAALSFRPSAAGGFGAAATDSAGRATWRAPLTVGTYTISASQGARAATLTLSVAVPRTGLELAPDAANRSGFVLSRELDAEQLDEVGAKDFETLVRDATAALQSSNPRLADLSPGSVLRAIVESSAANGLWLQGLALNVLSKSRASTAAGRDLDTWAADFGLARLEAAAARGEVRLARFTAGLPAYVPAGAIVQTADGFSRYAVLADPEHPAWLADQAAYQMDSAASSVTVPVQALARGAAGNAQAGAVDTIGSAIPGIDTVTNEAPIDNGADAESDENLRARFVAYLASLSRATRDAIGFALDGLRADYSIVENAQRDGTPDAGYVYVVVDDGTGAPTADFIARAHAAVDAVRPVGTRFGVFAPQVLVANVALRVAAKPGFDAAAVRQAVQQGLRDRIGAMRLGESLPYTRLAQIAYEASEGVQNALSITLNGGSADLNASAQQVVRAGTVTVSA